MNFDLPEMDCYKAVWLAVLQQAIADLVSEAGDSEIPRRTATRWFKSNADHVGSFKWVCNVVNLDTEAVLVRVRERIREHDGTIAEASQAAGSDGARRTLRLPRRVA